jgi:hypothetical protein
MLNPEAIVQRRLEAYNARNLAALLALCAEHIRVYRPPSAEPVIIGRSALGDFYARNRFNKQGLRAELLNRMVLGNRVIDHERISGVRDQPYEVAIVYEVASGLIQRMWFYAPD